ncbi:coiled-coil domain-containing protein 27 [Candoia aspera]|uniref:coiled-coil domain-containing protein 27 n=1 Tax=Candoia aspera TaxID=51853 RepID=UPI002FD7DBC2
MEKNLTLMTKGLNELRKTSSLQQPNPLCNHPESRKLLPSKAFHAIRKYYEKLAEDQRMSSSVSDYIPDTEDLQKCFQKRPGCPQYCHRGTSTAPLENTLRVRNLPVNLSTVSLTSQVSLDDWNTLLQNPEFLDSRCRFRFYPSSSFECVPGLPKQKSFTEDIIPQAQVKKDSASKIPWYLPVLHEKDQSLNRMGEELARLSPFEAECIRKDGVIEVLMEEVQTLQNQLDQLQKLQAVTPEKPPDQKRVSDAWAKGDVTKLPTLGISPSVRHRQKGIPLICLDQTDIPEELRQEVKCLELELSQPEETLDSKVLLLSMELLKDQEELEQLEKEGLLGTEEETLSSSGSKAGEMESDLEESENALILYKLLEFQKVNEMLYEELQKMQSEYDLATGAISSLQRQLSFEGSQLRKAHMDQELLQKELWERGEQLEAMSNKFCNLREERKHQELMGSIEGENFKLRQEVARLEGQLAEKSQLVGSLQSNLSQLQSELLVSHYHSGKQLSSQSELQKQLEILQRVEQQTRVTLESISARFERFRSKIIQATYSTPGTKSPQGEITDDEVLEALQKIITDRLDFHQMLKQKGVKVPSLSSEPAPPPAHKKKTVSK